jgi:hypothetical protein
MSSTALLPPAPLESAFKSITPAATSVCDRGSGLRSPEPPESDARENSAEFSLRSPVAAGLLSLDASPALEKKPADSDAFASDVLDGLGAVLLEDGTGLRAALSSTSTVEPKSGSLVSGVLVMECASVVANQ